MHKLRVPLHAPRLRFSDHMTQQAPDRAGVYVLWCGDKPIYAGKTGPQGDTLRAAIRRHIRGEGEPLMLQATHFSFVPTVDPDSKYFNLVLDLGWMKSTSGPQRSHGA